jgi:hypothetical protein
MGVVALDGLAISGGHPGPLTLKIAAQFRAELRLDPARPAG